MTRARWLAWGLLVGAGVAIAIAPTDAQKYLRRFLVTAGVTTAPTPPAGCALDSGYSEVDLGAGLPGQACFSSGTWTISGSGLIGSTSDNGHFAYQSLSGDREIIGRVTAVSSTGGLSHGNEFCSVMVRNGTAANSPFARAIVDGNGQALATRRLTAGASSSLTTGSFHQWIRVQVISNLVSIDSGTDGVSWTSLLSDLDIGISGGSFRIGIAADNTDTAALTTCTLTSVTITTPADEEDSGCYRPEIPPLPGCGNTGGRDPAASIFIVDQLTDDAASAICTGTCGGTLSTTACDDTTCRHGSLRSALLLNECRHIVFYGSGNYSLSESDVPITSGCLTVMGQSAPSPGVTIRHGGLWVLANNTIFQHVRMRPGDGGDLLLSTADHNAVLIGYGAFVQNALFDHVSISWAGGKNFETTPYLTGGATAGNRGPRGVVFWRSITSESLWRASNTSHDSWTNGFTGVPASFGWHGFMDIDGSLSMVESLSAHNATRNPEYGDGELYMLSNVIYDFGRDCAAGTSSGNCSGRYPWAIFKYVSAVGTHSRANIISNKCISGPNTPVSQLYCIGIWTTTGSNEQVYQTDNAVDAAAGGPIQTYWVNAGVSDPNQGSPVLSMSGISTVPSSSVEAFVSANAGARPTDRDSVDTRILSQLSGRTGSVISGQGEVGGWPSLANNTSAIDIPTNPNGLGTCGGSRSRIECWALAKAQALEP